MVTNSAKEQFYSPTKKVLDLRRTTHPKYIDSISHKAKDLGVSQRALNATSSARQKRMRQLKGKAQRVKTLQGGKRPKITISRASLQTGAMYACEVDPLTLQNIHQLRMGVAVGLNLEWGPRNKIASMLFRCTRVA